MAAISANGLVDSLQPKAPAPATDTASPGADIAPAPRYPCADSSGSHDCDCCPNNARSAQPNSDFHADADADKYRDADNPEQLINGRRRYSRTFDAFVPYLQQRIHQDGITNAAQLFTELRRQGYRGSRRTVRRYLNAPTGETKPTAEPAERAEREDTAA